MYCGIVPIGVILGALFYGLWYISPNTQHMKIYQEEIFNWNTNKLAT